MMIDVIDGKALLRGILIFLALYLFHVALLPQLVGEKAATSDSQGLLYFVNQVLGLATCLIPGYVAARMAGHHGFAHGGLVGAVSTILTALLAMLWAIVTGARFSGLAMLPFWLVINAFLCAFAGLVATSVAEDDSPA